MPTNESHRPVSVDTDILFPSSKDIIILLIILNIIVKKAFIQCKFRDNGTMSVNLPGVSHGYFFWKKYYNSICIIVVANGVGY